MSEPDVTISYTGVTVKIEGKGVTAELKINEDGAIYMAVDSLTGGPFLEYTWAADMWRVNDHVEWSAASPYGGTPNEA